MVLKHSTAKIIDLETTFDANPVTGPDGDMLWADVRIDYILSGLFPRVTIRVPVPWSANETLDQRRAKALSCARELIDHACRASGVSPQEAEQAAESSDVKSAPPILEGITQELGLAAPTARPNR